MRKSFVALSGLALATALAATPAMAQEEAAPAVTINGSATVVSDYRFRGISQTNKRFAVQGSLTVSHESGLYATVWGSSIDDYVAAGSDQEIDLIVGFAKTFGGTKVDFGVLYYYYPGSGGANSDFFEPYLALSHTFGSITGKVSAAYAPKQAAIGLTFPAPPPPGATVFVKEDNLYLAGDFSAAIPDTGIGLTAHIGHSFGPSYLTIGNEYTDWSLGATYTVKALTFGISYVDTNKNAFNGTRNISKAGVVGTVGVAF
jgi:uncharacterized protein (TIGR02001 family)